MQHHIQTLVKHFFHKESLQEVTVNQLQQFIDDYPYSAIGQLLLAKKLHDTGAQNFEEQGGKTTLYFHDPIWASWLLKQQYGMETAVFEQPGPVKETPHFVFDNPPAPESAEEEAEVDAPAETPPWEEPVSLEEQQPVVLEQEEAVNKFEPVTEEPVIDQTQQQAPTPPQPVETPAAATATDNGDMGFEPYHTIDYFAALGIKLKPEDLAKDKLGQQLRSFTDWLRSMKKTQPTPGQEGVNQVDDLATKSIQKIAEYSNEAKEIITEAMAEVWAKQGHRQKAVEIYEKLSLLNPSKSSYFASRIEALKSS